MVTISDIARSLGITPSTVSRALSGSERVKESTRKAVEETAEKATEENAEAAADESVEMAAEETAEDSGEELTEENEPGEQPDAAAKKDAE